jgi:hypothetical protein
MEPAAKRIKLPFGKTVAESYRWGLGRLPEVIRKFWLELIALTAVSFVLYWLVQPYDKHDGFMSLWWTVIIIPFISSIFVAMVAVPWHRLVLKGELLSGSTLRIDRRVLTYAIWGTALLLPFLASLSLFGAAFPDGAPENDDSTPINWGYLITAFAAFLAGIFSLTRLSLRLVSAALDDKRGTIRTIWHNTSWSFWRLFCGTIITFLPSMLAVVAIPFYDPQQSRLSYAAMNAAMTLVSTILGMIPLTFLSLAYRHFMMAPSERTAP